MPIGHFERATRLDPEFADAYVSLADAKLFVAEYEVTDDRAERFEAALREGRELVQRALAIDPENGDAYLQRAHLTAYDDRSAAEADFRKGLELSPNSAEGYAGLAAVLYADPARREEALQMLERARRIDPLEPGYDVFKAVFLMYERSDVSGADKLLSSVLERHPRYVPALLRQCEIRSYAAWAARPTGSGSASRRSRSTRWSQQARRVLIRTYLDIEDPVAAEQLADTSRGDEAVPRAFMALYRRDWTGAGEAAYEALERGTASPDNAGLIYAAIRLSRAHDRGCRPRHRGDRASRPRRVGWQWQANASG